MILIAQQIACVTVAAQDASTVASQPSAIEKAGGNDVAKQKDNAADKATKTATEDKTASDNATSDKIADTNSTIQRYPSQFPDGRSTRVIAFFESQMSRLVPKNYRPVELDQLRQAVDDLVMSQLSVAQDALARAEYNATFDNGVLYGSGTFQFDHSVATASRPMTSMYRLGVCNLAIRSVSSEVSTPTGPAVLMNDPSGILFANAPSDSMEFDWTLASEMIDGARQFVVEFPTSPVGRFEITLPDDIRIASPDCPIALVPKTKIASDNDRVDDTDAPAMIDVLQPEQKSSQSETKTYRIDIGGLTRLRLIMTQQQSTPSSIVLRQLDLSYEATPYQLEWSQSMSIQVDETSDLNQFLVHGGRVKSVIVDGVACRYTVSSRSPETSAVRIELPSYFADGDFDTLPIQFNGTAEINVTRKHPKIANATKRISEPLTAAPAMLPYVTLDKPHVLAALTGATAELRVNDATALHDWRLPNDWAFDPDDRLVDPTTIRNKSNGINGAAAEATRKTDDSPANEFVAAEQAPFASAGRVVAATGPAINCFLGTEDRTSNDTTSQSWSTIRVAPLQTLADCKTFLRLEVDRGRVSCEASVLISVQPQAVRPIEFLIEPEWNVTSVRFTTSVRSIETPNLNEVRQGQSANAPVERVLVIWPEPGDLTLQSDGSTVLGLEIAGDRRILSQIQDKGTVDVPPTWFARAVDASHSLVAAVLRPPDLQWAGDTTLKQSQIDIGELTDSEINFINAPPDLVTVFRPSTLRTPALSLAEPNRSLDARVRTRLTHTDGEISETVSVEFSSSTATGPQIEILSGSSRQRGAFRWTLQHSDQQNSIVLPDSRTRIEEQENTDVYRIDLSGQILVDAKLIGQREFSIETFQRIDGDKKSTGYDTPSEPVSIVLPSVASVSNHQSEVYLGPSLQPMALPHGVVSVTSNSAFGQSDTPNTSPPPQTFRSDRDSHGQREYISSSNPRDVGGRVLRYDSSEQPVIQVAVSDSQVSLPLVWDEVIEVTAAASGVDRIETRYRVSAESDVTISYPVSCTLTSIVIDGTETDDVIRTANSVRIAGHADQSITLNWIRNRVNRGALNRCVVPRISITGVVFNRQVGVSAADDTFIPGSFFHAAVETTPKETGLQLRRGFLRMDTGDSFRLMHRNVALAFGVLFAIFWFAGCWSLAKRLPTAGIGILALATFASVLWGSWATAIVGWISIPTVTAFMLVAVQRYRRELTGEFADPENDFLSDAGFESVSNAPAINQQSFSLSITSPKLWFVFAFAIGIAGYSIASAQSPGTRLPANKAIGSESAAQVDLLVPVDESGYPAGNKVYVPRSAYDRLFRPQDTIDAVDVTIESAAYRIELRADAPQSPEITCEYAVRSTIETEMVRLPIDFDLVNRVELVNTNSQRLIRHSPASADRVGTVCPVPPSDRFRFRVNFNCDAVGNDTLFQLLLSIPPVNQSSLVVDAQDSFDRVHVDGARGQTTPSELLRRVDVDLGPTESIDLAYRVRPTEEEAPEPLRPIYWLHAATDRVVCECEVQPRTDGESDDVQLVVIANQLPREISTGWEISSQEALSADRWLISFRRTGMATQTLRLAWESILSAGDIDYVMPKVIASATRETAAPWIALSSDRGVQVDVDSRVQTEPLAPQQLRERWQGFQNRPPERAFVAMTRVPDFQIKAAARNIASVVQSQSLTLDSQDAMLNFEATLTPSDGLRSRHALRYPKGLTLLAIKVNGSSLDDEFNAREFDTVSSLDANESNPTSVLSASGTIGVPVLAGDAMEVNLPPSPTIDSTRSSRTNETQTIKVEALFSLPVRLPGQTRLPFVELTNVDQRQGTYQLARTSDVSVRYNDSQPAAGLPSDGYNRLESSAVSQAIPIRYWPPHNGQLAIENNVDTIDFVGTEAELYRTRKPDGWTSVRARATTRRLGFASTQLTRLIWDTGRWSFLTTVKLPAGELPDYIDVLVPTRWCDRLDVENVDSWSRQPAADPGRQVVRVSTSRFENGQSSFRMSGSLTATDQTRLTAPRIEVLGRGQRTVFLSLPRRLADDRIQWRLSSLRELGTPPAAIADLAPDSNSLLLRIDNPSWLAELEPSTNDVKELSVQVADIQVFLGERDGLVLGRWDVAPGASQQIELRLPAECEPLGAWVAGQIVPLSPMQSLASELNPASNLANPAASRKVARFESDTDKSPATRVLRVPVAFTRLPQSIEILIRVPLSARGNTNYIPLVTSINSYTTWVTILDTEGSSRGAMRTDTRSQQHRLFSLGRSVATLMEKSSNLLADRPSDETTQWIQPWMARYREILSAAGHAGLLQSRTKINTGGSDENDDKGQPSGRSVRNQVSDPNQNFPLEPIDDRRTEDSPQSSHPQHSVDRRDSYEQEPQGLADFKLASSDTAEQSFNWNWLTERVRQQTGRFNSFDASETASPFRLTGQQQYQAVSVTQIATGTSPPALVMASTSTETLRRILVNFLVFSAAIAVLVAMIPYRHHVRSLCLVPSFWLALLGFCSLVVSPLQVSLALLLVALALPTKPSSSHRKNQARKFTAVLFRKRRTESVR